MGGVLSSIYRLLYRQKHFKIVMFALPGGGRTTMLYKWKLGLTVPTIPTIGFNVETIEYRDVMLTFWDLGGGDKIRPLWRHYFSSTKGVIYVIDSSERETMEEVKYELGRLMTEDELREAPFLIYANKQDKEGAMGAAEIGVRLGVECWSRDRRWTIVESSAVREAAPDQEHGNYSDGLQEGLEWLYGQLVNPSWNNVVLNSRSRPKYCTPDMDMV